MKDKNIFKFGATKRQKPIQSDRQLDISSRLESAMLDVIEDESTQVDSYKKTKETIKGTYLQDTATKRQIKKLKYLSLVFGGILGVVFLLISINLYPLASSLISIFSMFGLAVCFNAIGSLEKKRLVSYEGLVRKLIRD